MAIKWKNWTRLRVVKIICWVLIPVMGFVFLLNTFGLSRVDVGRHGLGLLFADLTSTDYFFDTNMSQALNHLETAFTLRDERSIRRGDHIEWTRHHRWERSWEHSYSEVEEFYTYDLRGIMDWHFGTMDVPVDSADEFFESERVIRIEESAIESQLSIFRYSLRWLEEQDGLYYFVTNRSHTLSNIPRESRNADFFRGQPVYLISESTGALQISADTGRLNHFRYAGSFDGEFAVHIAFSQEAVNYQTERLLVAQRQLGVHIAAMVGSFFVSLVALIILMIGAGRVWGGENGEVRFAFTDKPYLDFSLVALIFYLFTVVRLSFDLAEFAWRHGNFFWTAIFFAVLSVSFTLPLVWWVLSFTKRFKAGRFWLHTMIYTAIKAAYDFVKSSWAGVSLTAKVVLIGGILFTSSVFFILLADSRAGVMALFLSFLFTAFAMFLMLRYARRIHLLDKGAKAVSGGDYDVRIDVTGGELGSVAASINNISGGINNAVIERMKSERLKTELITNVSHDIRTPLTSLITYTDLLKTEGLDSQQAPEYLEILIQKTARLKTLTDDLFEASKAASGNVNVNLETLDLVDFVRQVLGEMDERVRASGLDFRLNLPDHAFVCADGKLLWRVMENLLSNVFKYAMAGSRVYVDVLPDEQWYRLDIKNISDYPLNVEPFELTERFKRGDSARAGEGSGLGLSIAQGFVQSQGGKFTLSIDGDLFKTTVHLQKEV